MSTKAIEEALKVVEVVAHKVPTASIIHAMACAELEVLRAAAQTPDSALPVDPYTTMVREFHERMGLVVRDAPSLGTPAEREERVRLMLEELLELARALGVGVYQTLQGPVTMEAVKLFQDFEPDMEDVLHELADLQMTVSGTAVQLGLPLLSAAREVHAANMAKTPQGPGRKPLKPEGWKPADVSGLVSAAIQDAPGAVLRQLAGADPSQPASVVLAGSPVRTCDPEMHRVNGFCLNCSDGWL